MAKWVIHGKGPTDLVDAAIPDAKYYAEKVDQLRQSSGLDRLIKTYDIPNGTVTVTALEHVRTVSIDVAGGPAPTEEEEKKKPPTFRGGGYEFTTPDAYYLFYNAGNSYTESLAIFSSVKYTLVAVNSDGLLIGVKPDGSPILPTNDSYAEQADAYSYGRQWPAEYAANGPLSILLPGTDWFSIPHPATDEEAAGRAAGYPDFQAATIAGSPSHRYANRLWSWMTKESSFYSPVVTPALIWLPTTFFQQVVNGTVYGTSGLPTSLDGGATTFAMHGNACSVLNYPNMFVASPYDGGDMKHFYLFVINSLSPYNVSVYWLSMAAYRPGWVTYENDYFSYAPDFENLALISNAWFWRGDGKRAISVQYNYGENEHPSHYPGDPTTFEFREATPGIVEVGMEITVTPTLNAARSLRINKYPMQAQWPIAADYNMLDSRRRCVAYFEAYVGPVHTHEADDTAQPEYMRPLLVYLRFAEMDSAGNLGTPYFSRPVMHIPWFSSSDEYIDADTPHGIVDASGYSAIVISGAESDYPFVTANPSFRTTWGYDSMVAHIPALDLRADAYVLNYQFDVMTQPILLDTDLRDSFKINLFREWGVWGVQRGVKWAEQFVTYAGASWTHSAVLDLGEDAQPSFLTALQTVPAGYTLFTPASSLWNEWSVQARQFGIGSSLGQPLPALTYLYFRTIFCSTGRSRSEPFAEAGGGVRIFDSLNALYDGFTLSPNKSFAVYCRDDRHYGVRSFAAPPYYYAGYNVQREAWFELDHIERIKDGEPIVDTHYAVYNRTRGTALTTLSDEPCPETIRARAMWIE